jgi:hypothetical protein
MTRDVTETLSAMPKLGLPWQDNTQDKILTPLQFVGSYWILVLVIVFLGTLKRAGLLPGETSLKVKKIS